jgi:hypothetical protein
MGMRRQSRNGNEERKTVKLKRKNFATPIAYVKCLVSLVGISMGDFAAAAKISQSVLTLTLSGQRRTMNTQKHIWRAAHRVLGVRLSFAKFWGDLAGPKLAERRAA